MQNKKHCRGSSTIEIAIIMPIVFALILASVMLFLILYQKALIQNVAENMAESLSRHWNYKSLTFKEEVENGAYTKNTYSEREVYWDLKFWTYGRKKADAEKYIKEKVMYLGPLKPARTNGRPDGHVDVSVNYKYGLITTVTVNIAAHYKVPGSGLLKLAGLDDLLIIRGEAQAQVYNAKNMINTTDYVIQLIRNTKAYDMFMEKLKPVKDALNKIIGK